MRRAALALFLALLPAAAAAQSVPVYQMGTALGNDLAKFQQNGQIRNAVGIAGDNNGMGANPFSVTDYKQLGFCSNSAATTGPYSRICIGHNTAGDALLTVDSQNGEPSHGFRFELNGQLASSLLTLPLAMDITSAPPWATWYETWDAVRFSVNGYPVSGQTKPGQVGEEANFPTALTAGINIPSTAISTPPTHGTGVWGGALSASTQLGAVGVYGFGGMTAAGVSTWGMNPIATNCPTPNCRTLTGYNGGTNAAVWGSEVNVNIFKTASGAAPTNLAVRGVEITGGSETAPGSGSSSFGLSIRPLGVATTIPWGTGINISDGAATTGINLGATGQPGSSSGGQQVCWNSYDGTSSAIASCMSSSPGGTLLHNAAAQNQFQVQGTTYAAVTDTNLVLSPRSTAPSSNSLSLLLNAVNSAGTTLNPSIQAVASGTNAGITINASGSGVTLATDSTAALRTFVTPTSAQAGIALIVNNNAGVNVVTVTLGATDSCGVGYRCMRVPN